MKKPKVTVLLPVYNGEGYLAEAIESILQQTLRDFEFLIINDGSTDHSLEIVSHYKDSRLHIVSRSNKGLIATLNEGIELAKAPLIARMDQDDISKPDRLSKQVGDMERHPETILLGSGAQIIDSTGAIIGARAILNGSTLLQRALAVTNPFVHGSVVFRKEAAVLAGGYREAAYLTEDYDLWSRLTQQGEVNNYSEYLYYWRVNPTGMSFTGNKDQKKASMRLANSIWKRFEPQGPAPRSDWSSLWPQTDNNVNQKDSRILLHWLFGRGYARRGHLVTAIEHLVTALGLSKNLFRPK